MTKLLYTDLMLDIETLGTGADSVILSIAAVPFRKTDGLIQPSYFHHNVSIQSCLDLGMKIDASTLDWWMDKAETFKSLRTDAMHIRQALTMLSRYIQECNLGEARIWGKGPSFDNAILKNAFDRCGFDLPWKYSKERCVRTYLCGYEDRLRDNLNFQGEPHNPVADAMYQIRCMRKIQFFLSPVRDIGHE